MRGGFKPPLKIEMSDRLIENECPGIQCSTRIIRQVFEQKKHTHTKKTGELRIPDSYDAKIAKISNLWTFWPLIQVINHLYIYGALVKKAFCRNLERLGS